MNARIDPSHIEPAPQLDPSELDRGMMNMRVVALAAMMLLVIVVVVLTVCGGLWLALR